MALYKISTNQELVLIKESPFKLEKEIQTLTEINLQQTFNLSFVKSEFALNKFRIDTLAFNSETSSFVIIEYKRDKSFSVIDQGYAYLSLMLNNKADFILEYNENCKTQLKREDVDWTQSKVIFMSPSFTPYQKEAINFKDLPIELWEFKRYSNDTVGYSQISTSGSEESIKTISQDNSNIEQVTKEVKVYSESEHIEKTSEEIRELYEKFKTAVLNLGEFEIKPTKLYIGYIHNSHVLDVCILKGSLKIWLNLLSGQLDDPKGIARDVSNTGHWGNGDYEIQMKNDDDLEYILSLVKQSFKQN